MKKHLIIATFAALALIATACGKENGAATNESADERATSASYQYEAMEAGVAVSLSDINPEIMQFVETHFPQTSIFNCHQTQYYYKVKLDDGTKLRFTHSFDWVDVDCEHSTIYTFVPASLVPEQITAYVTANFPTNQIEQIEKENFGWEIELDNDRDIKFDHDFNVINNGGGTGTGTGTGTSDFPEINTFVATHFPQVSIRSARQDGNEIEVKLTDNTELDFYLNYDWKNIDCNESTVYGIVPAELVPTQITDYVTANFPANHIDQIEKENYGWDIELDNNREIKFDHNFNVISGGNNGGGNGGNTGGNTSNYPEINTFVETYFPLTTIKTVKLEGNEIEVKLNDKTEIDFYINFDWKSIDCEKGTVYGSVPAELVPAQITTYVAANFAGKTIESIEKKNNGGWEIELSNGLEITFDANFNVTEIDDKK